VSWAANWYKRGDVVIGKESVSVGSEKVLSVVMSSASKSVMVSNKPAASVTIGNTEKSINVSDNSVSIDI